MSIHELPISTPPSLLAKPGTGSVTSVLWAALLALSAVGSSWALACVTPFAAFALVSARTLPLKAALGTAALVWLSNQAVGFLFLGYPLTASCILWGIATGAASLAATFAAAGTMRLPVATPVKLAAGLITAFGVYEGSLLGLALVTRSMDGFTLPIIGNFLLTNAAWSAALLITHRLITRLTATKGLPNRRAF